MDEEKGEAGDRPLEERDIERKKGRKEKKDVIQDFLSLRRAERRRGVEMRMSTTESKRCERGTDRNRAVHLRVCVCVCVFQRV